MLLAVSVFSETTLNNPTGLIEMPTAKAIEYKQFSVAVDYQFPKTNQKKGVVYFKGNVGAYDNLELGFVGGTTPEEGVFVNAKYFIMADSEAYPTSLAVGFQNMGSKRDSSLYIVASKVFEEGLEGHFGFRAIFDDKIDSSAMLGIEYFF